MHLPPGITQDTPRHAPEGFPFPIWSDADVARYRANRSESGVLKDRRKLWQLAIGCWLEVDLTGSVLTEIPEDRVCDETGLNCPHVDGDDGT